MPPLVSAVQIETSEAVKFQNAAPEVKGTIVGRLLAGSKIAFVGPVPEGTTVEVAGEPEGNRLNFVVKSPKPIPPGTPFTFQISNTKGAQSFPYSVSYTPKLPTLTGVEPDPAEAEAGSEVTLTLKGTNFIPNTDANPRATRVIVEPASSRLRVVSVDVTSATTLDVTLSVDGKAPRRTSKLRVVNAAGQSVESIDFTVKDSPSQ
jgi:hypothetical protein